MSAKPAARDVSGMPAGSRGGESLEEANARLALLNHIVSVIGSSRGMEEVIELAVHSLGRAFPGVRVSYSRVDPEGRVVVLRSVEPAGMPAHQGTTWELAAADEYLAAIRRQELVVSGDVEKDPRLGPLGASMKSSGVAALATAALPEAAGSTGLLSFNAPAPRSWSEHEVATLTEAAAHLFLAIQEARHQKERAAALASQRHRVELENLLVRVSTDFINMPAVRIDRAISELLPDLGRAADADGVLVFLFSDDRSELVKAFEWLAPAVAPDRERPAALATWELPGLMKTLARLEPFSAPNARLASPEELFERELFERYGIRSLLGIPISTRGELLGFVSLVQLLSERGWRDEAVAVLRVVGDILGGALDRKVSDESLEQARAQLEAGNRELERSNRNLALLNELGDLLQSCNRFEEASGVIDDLLPRLFPDQAGAVYLSGSSGSLLEAAASWGDPPPDLGPFDADDCWALRRGRPHRVAAGGAGPTCRHAGAGVAGGTICLPLMAQAQSLGVFHLRGTTDGPQADPLPLALAAAEHLALGLANLLLRERLRSQALRDPLTGLVNRPYLEEQIAREVLRAHRHEAPLALALLHLDGLEAVGRDHGPEEADLLLSRTGRLLMETLPPEGLAARLEGSELGVLLPEHDSAQARAVAVTWAERIRGLALNLGRRRFMAGTLSVGLAAFPASANDGEELEAAAARALASALAEGGDVLVTAEEPYPGRRALRAAGEARAH